MSRESESLQRRLFTRTQEVAGLANALSSCYHTGREKEVKWGSSYPWMNSFPKRRRVVSLREEISEALRLETSILLELMQALQERRISSPSRRWGTVTRNLLTYIRGLENDGVQEREYLELFRKEVLLFQKDWKRLKRIS
jgi:hypothetical protein